MSAVWLRALSRFFNAGPVRRLISTPAAEHQIDLAAFVHRHREEGLAFLEELGGAGDVVGKRVLDLGCGFGTRVVAVAESGAAAAVGGDIDLEKSTYGSYSYYKYGYATYGEKDPPEPPQATL